MYKVYLVVQLGLDIKDDLKYNVVNKFSYVHLVNSVKLGLSQNNAPWVLSVHTLEKSCLLCHYQGLHIMLCGFIVCFYIASHLKTGSAFRRSPPYNLIWEISRSTFI